MVSMCHEVALSLIVMLMLCYDQLLELVCELHYQPQKPCKMLITTQIACQIKKGFLVAKCCYASPFFSTGVLHLQHLVLQKKGWEGPMQ